MNILLQMSQLRQATYRYMLEPYTKWKVAMDYGKANEATPYYCFYVKYK
jgi:hypothetical protein